MCCWIAVWPKVHLKLAKVQLPAQADTWLGLEGYKTTSLKSQNPYTKQRKHKSHYELYDYSDLSDLDPILSYCHLLHVSLLRYRSL